MNKGNSISYERSTVSIGKEIYLKAKSYGKKNTIKFSNLVEIALKKYLDDTIALPTKENEEFFVDLCDQLAGHTTTKKAKEQCDRLNISQREFTEHLLKEAVILLRRLKETHDLSRIHCHHVDKKGNYIGIVQEEEDVA